MIRAQVQRMEDGANRRDREIRFEMLLAGARERGNPIARLDAEILKGDSQSANPVDDLRIRRPRRGSVGTATDHLSFWK